MNIEELIEALDQRYGNPLTKGNELILEAIKVLREINNGVEMSSTSSTKLE